MDGYEPHLAEEAADLNCPVEDIETQDDAIFALDLQSTI